MDFKCYICSDLFKSSNVVIDHLRNIHSIKENRNSNIQCIVNKPNKCDKTFETFSGLRRHITKCENDKPAEKSETKQAETNTASAPPNLSLQAEGVDELSYAIDHEFHLNAVSGNKNIDYIENPIVYANQNKSEFELANEEAETSLAEFCTNIIRMNLNEKKTNEIFRLTEKIVRDLQKFNVRLMNDDDHQISPVKVIESTTDFFVNELEKRKTTFKRNLINRKNEAFVHPKELSIGTRWERKKFTDGNGAQISIPRIVQNTYQYIQVKETIQFLFKSREFCDMYFNENTVLDHKCEKGKYKYFCCGQTYQKSEFFKENPLAVQLHLSSDDFEICSPLQSKAGVHKICAIYLTIQNIPPKYLSKYNNIYLVALCNADDLKSKTTDFNNLWQEIVRDINYLETVGVEIDGRPNLKCTLTHLSFDNLGANLSLGYVACFSSSHFCRHCLRSKDQCQIAIEDDSDLIRTKFIYNEQLRIVQNSEKVKYDETKGVKFYCKLNDLLHFHIIDNPTVDIMHDLAEGIVPFLIKNLLLHAFNKKIFNENDFNWMTQFYSYGWLHRHEIPSSICLNKRSLGQNAVQSLCLFKHLPMILYEYRHNEHLRNVWPCVISLLRILEIVYSYEVTDELLDILKAEIRSHLASIREILHEHLRPKHHFMLHYPYLFRIMGPLIHLIMMRFEAKHQQIKRLLSDNRNFRNINKTLANKHQRAGSTAEFSYKNEIETKKINPSNPSFIATLQLENDLNVQIGETEYLRINNYEYMPNLLFIHKKCVYQIKKVLLIGNDYVLFANKCIIGVYDSFLNCSEIDVNTSSSSSSQNESDSKILIKINDLANKKTFDLYNVNGKNYILAATIDLNKTYCWK